ncbi:MAG: rod shape-determining protein MreC [Gammaproteobacteria bacterium]|nr:rod shape-determining protein MreC [Gammaproteobacteria bacterium]
MPFKATSQESIFRRGNALTLKMVIILLLSLTLFVIDHRQHKSHQLRVWIENAMLPVHHLIDFPRIFSLWVLEGVRSQDSLQEENASLRSKNLLLQHKLQKQEAIESENSRLRKLLNASFIFGTVQKDDKVRLAEIIAVDLDAFNQEVVLNKGSRDGAYVGQPLMDATGVMGQIIRITPHSSTALLLSSPRHSIPVQSRRNGLRTLAMGTGHPNRLSLRFVPSGSDLILGDTLITSGLGGRFPYGYPVGTVHSINAEEGAQFSEITLTPTSLLERSREVLLVWPDSITDPLQ